jgi:hypothetical protein
VRADNCSAHEVGTKCDPVMIAVTPFDEVPTDTPTVPRAKICRHPKAKYRPIRRAPRRSMTYEQVSQQNTKQPSPKRNGLFRRLHAGGAGTTNRTISLHGSRCVACDRTTVYRCDRQPLRALSRIARTLELSKKTNRHSSGRGPMVVAEHSAEALSAMNGMAGFSRPSAE